MTAVSWSCLLCLLLAEPGSGYVLKVEPATRIEAVFESSAENAELEASEWILYAAKPPLLPCQDGISASLEPSGRSTVERGPLRRSLLWTRLPVKGQKYKTGVRVTVHFGVKPLAFLQGIAYWVVAAESIGGLEIQQRWQVRKLPIGDGE